MEQTFKKHRIENILICLAGVICCIAAFCISAPEGILGDESISMMQMYEGTQQILFVAIPTVLVILACIDVIIGKVAAIAVILALAGGVLCGVTDVTLISGHQGFSGVLVNAIGAILVIAGACLQAFATERAETAADEDDILYDETRPVEAYSDIYITDIKEMRSAGEIESTAPDVDVPVKTEQGSKPASVTITRQPEVPQSEAITDFYAGIEEMFLTDTKNGGKANE